jgi:hypothetical protein
MDFASSPWLWDSGAPRPTFERDFARDKELDRGGTGPAITFTRASDATFFDASGTLQTAANDTPRFDHSGGSSLGLLIEEARTNSIRNSQAGGSTNGVIGSGGVLPTNWSISANANGITSEIIDTGTEDGLAYIDIKMSGTPTAGGTVLWRTETDTQVVAANGQTWTHSAYIRLVGGSTANVATARISISGRVAGGAQVLGQGGDTIYTPTSAALKTQRQSRTFTFTDATVERILPFYYISYTSGDPIDLTLRIAAPQLEQGAFPTSYIPTTAAAATRSADSAVVTPISSFYNQAEGTLFAQLSTLTTAAGTFPYSLSIDDNTNNNRIEIYASSSSSTVTVVSSGASQSLTSFAGAITAGVAFSAGVAFRANDLAFSTNGLASLTDASVLLPVSPDRLRIKPATNSHIRKIAYWPKRLSNTLLEQLTT